jgi:hypothetical protein
MLELSDEIRLAEGRPILEIGKGKKVKIESEVPGAKIKSLYCSFFRP